MLGLPTAPVARHEGAPSCESRADAALPPTAALWSPPSRSAGRSELGPCPVDVAGSACLPALRHLRLEGRAQLLHRRSPSNERSDVPRINHPAMLPRHAPLLARRGQSADPAPGLHSQLAEARRRPLSNQERTPPVKLTISDLASPLSSCCTPLYGADPGQHLHHACNARPCDPGGRRGGGPPHGTCDGGGAGAAAGATHGGARRALVQPLFKYFPSHSLCSNM